MLLEPLISVIETLKKRIAVHGASLRENETRTRLALIDPLLQILGWDTADPAMVMPEYSVSKGRADYALLTPTGQPSAVLEAKRLSEGLENHNTQMVAYALEEGVVYAGLTDGDRWHIYDVFKPVPLSDKRILDISIASTPAHEAALKLLLLWRPNLSSGQPAANAPVHVPKPDDGSSTPVSVAYNGPPGPVNPILVQPPPSVARPSPVLPQPTGLPATVSIESGWIRLSAVEPRDAPAYIRFPDSTLIEIKGGWTDAWFQVCEWLASTGRLTEHDCPIRISNRASRYLVHTTPYHSNKREFGQGRKTTTGLFVERQYQPRVALNNARFLLDKFRVPVDTLELRFEGAHPAND